MFGWSHKLWHSAWGGNSDGGSIANSKPFTKEQLILFEVQSSSEIVQFMRISNVLNSHESHSV